MQLRFLYCQGRKLNQAPTWRSVIPIGCHTKGSVILQGFIYHLDGFLNLIYCYLFQLYIKFLFYWKFKYKICKQVNWANIIFLSKPSQTKKYLNSNLKFFAKLCKNIKNLIDNWVIWWRHQVDHCEHTLANTSVHGGHQTHNSDKRVPVATLCGIFWRGKSRLWWQDPLAQQSSALPECTALGDFPGYQA